MLTEQKFIGMANYEALWNDRVFWEVLGNTVWFMVLTVTINVVLALLVASGLKHAFFGSDFLRVLFYAPGILSVSVLGIIGFRIWDTQLGIINFFLTDVLGLGRIPWLGRSDPRHPRPLDHHDLVDLRLPHAGLYCRAAQHPGARSTKLPRSTAPGPCSTFRHITMPLIMPTMLFVVVTQFIAHMQVFAQPYIITAGGPGNASRSVVMYLYETAWKFFRFGYASAIAVVLAVIMIVVTVVLFSMMRRPRRVLAPAGATHGHSSIRNSTARLDDPVERQFRKSARRSLLMWLIFLPLAIIIIVPLFT